ncbi:class I SAM-dependent methyltransferase [Microcella alkalica]|uniref:Putative O-methyltransferase YrrM n=1 Tax=Microcella alkalica TaxID=355930 RepID=A0A839EI19_9MICO|nr:putative O-methyltransferase YrrM [Microcella alkalica]
MPEYVVDSAWLGHAPFAAWLLSQLRPRVALELGTHQGFSYFAMCEFAERLHLRTNFYAVDTWRGDEHAGFYEDDVYRAVSRWNERYSDRSSLLRMTFDKARTLVEDRSIDLLHVDGRHRYEDVAHDFKQYEGALSERGVVIFHDIAERSGDFGVYRFWQEIAERYPTFAFTHSHGLGVALVGDDQPPALRSLCESDPSQRDAVRAKYDQLGLRVSGIRDLLVQAAASAELEQQLQVLTQKSATRIAELSDELDALKTSTSWKLTAPIRWVRSRVTRQRSEGTKN